MKIKEIDGVQNIILEENDRVILRSPEQASGVEVSYNNGLLDIESNAGIINQIKGAGLLEKVYIPPVITSEEIVGMCDEWFSIFDECLEHFGKIVDSSDKNTGLLSLRLSFNEYFDYNSNRKGRTINLELVNSMGALVHKGISIEVDNNDEDIYKYLYTLVVSKFLEVFCEGSTVNIEMNDTVYGKGSSIKKMCPGSMPVALNIIVYHNYGIPFDSIIDDAKQAICSRSFASSNFERSIERARKQYCSIFPESEKAKTFKLHQAEDK